MTKQRKFKTINELFDEIDAWMDLLQNKKELLGNINKPLNKKAFYTYSLNIDKRDYDKLEKAARKEKMSISKFVKTKYWQYFMHGGPNVYNVEYKYMILEIANRSQSGASKSIAMALNYNEECEFNHKLHDWGISDDKKRDLMKFFITQFLYGSYTLKNNNKSWIECNSSSIKAYAYDDKLSELFIMFHSDSVYVYYNVPKTVFYDLTHAESKGQFHNKFLMNRYEFKKIK